VKDNRRFTISSLSGELLFASALEDASDGAASYR